MSFFNIEEMDLEEIAFISGILVAIVVALILCGCKRMSRRTKVTPIEFV